LEISNGLLVGLELGSGETGIGGYYVATSNCYSIVNWS